MLRIATRPPHVRSADHSPMRRRAVAFALLCLQAACRSGGTETCFVRNGEPLISVDARDSQTGLALVEVTIARVAYGGVTLQDLRDLVDAKGAPTMQATVEGQTIRCRIVCGLASSPGEYAFVVSTPGYRDTSVTFNASYRRFAGGCPTVLTSGYRLSLPLRRS